MNVGIKREHPCSADALALIGELDAYLHSLYPRSACWGLSPQQLVEEGVAFFVARADGAAAGCGGLRLEESGYAELKRMYVRPSFRGMGVATLVLRHLEEHAVKNGVTTMRLETGRRQTEAIALYEKSGYHRIPRFGRYTEDGFSVFFGKRLV